MIGSFQLSSLVQYDQLIAGFSSGVVSTAVCHPLDLLKTRFSGNFSSFAYFFYRLISANEGSSLRPQYRSYFHATVSIVKAEGFRGMYQGFSPNVIGAALSWGLYFHWHVFNLQIKGHMKILLFIVKLCRYHQIKELFPKGKNYENLINFSSGMLAGTCVMSITNPIWVTKTRYQFVNDYDCSTQINALHFQFPDYFYNTKLREIKNTREWLIVCTKLPRKKEYRDCIEYESSSSLSINQAV